MLRLRSATLSVTIAVLAALTPATAQTTASRDRAAILVGDWRGESVCQVRPSACQDEDSLYHITPIAEKPGHFSMKADKIVAGKPVTMGIVECSFDNPKKMLSCDFERGIVQLTVNDDDLRGVMKLKDGTLWRKITLKKVR